MLKYYCFYIYHEYDIEDYYALKEQIKKLIQRGHLNKFHLKVHDVRIESALRGGGVWISDYDKSYVDSKIFVR